MWEREQEAVLPDGRDQGSQSEWNDLVETVREALEQWWARTSSLIIAPEREEAV